ncbi:alpha/beta hydrolase family protein [Nibrella saemangeumensis]|uniref:Alpha/beta hydrolase family protein n=1 Tax=Nibrella saemangeumensis TaxID=1084526 RepID=A0ABP8NKT6_9BACT
MNPPFRTIRVSDPRFNSEGLRYVTVKSTNLAGRGDITFWCPDLPDNNQEPLPLVILLHGVYGSHWAWTHNAGVHRTAARLIRGGQMPPMVLAMPSDGLWGDGSGYLPHPQQNFERWIIDDVPLAAATVFPELFPNGAVSTLFLTGLSMGGFGALRLTAKYPERVRGVYGLSSITHADQMSLFVEEPLSAYRQPDPVNESVLALMLQNRERLPPIGFDCGTEDLLLEHNRALHRALTSHGIPHTYLEWPGGHEWPYWERHIEDALLFFSKIS